MSMRKTLLILFALAVIAFLSYGAYHVFVLFWQSIKEASPSVASASIAGLVGLSLALLAYLKERTRAIREAHREKKIEVYTKFVDMVFSMIMANIKDKKSSQDDYLRSKEFMTSMIEFKRDILLYGAPNVINKFNDFQSASNDNEKNEILDAVENLFFAIRKDIGLSNFTLEQGALHRIYTIPDDVDNKESQL